MFTSFTRTDDRRSRYSRPVSSGAIVEVPSIDVNETVDRFVSLGWSVVDVFPADDPRRVTLEGHGVRLLVTRATGASPHLLLDGDTIVGSPSDPDLTRDVAPLVTPELVSSFSSTSGREDWHVGRAGMEYRDIVPDRQGGAIIASHIRIRRAGPVADYPHFHEVHFQLIFCQRGWVRLAYEGQGEPFVLHAGECVTQPPRIRHRVLECSDDLDVVEIGYPAEHMTCADHDFDFRASPVDPHRTWSGQRFVRHTTENASWVDVEPGVQESDTGVALATASRADVRVVHMASHSTTTIETVPAREFLLIFVLSGEVDLTTAAAPERLRLHDDGSAVIPVGFDARIEAVEVSNVLLVRVRADR